MTTRAVYPVLGRARPGAWCATCALPAANDYTVYALPATTGHQVPDGIGGLRLGDIRICTHCGEVTHGVEH